MRPKTRFKEKFERLYCFEADIELPRRCDLQELHRAEKVCGEALLAIDPTMVIHERPVYVEAIESGYRLLLTVVGSTAKSPCRHLADSDQRAPDLTVEPCKFCGRYVADD